MTDKNHEFARGHIDVDVLQHRLRAVGFADASQCQMRHAAAPQAPLQSLKARAPLFNQCGAVVARGGVGALPDIDDDAFVR